MSRRCPASTSESREFGVLATVITRICSTGRFNQRTGPDQPVKGELKGLLRSLNDRTGRYVGTAGSSPIRDITLDHDNARPSTPHIGQYRIVRGDCDCMAAQRHSPAGPNRGSVPQQPVDADMLAPRRRHRDPSPDMAWSTMGQWTDDEVGVDRADCAGAIPSCRARRRIGSEHDARSHGDVPLRRRPDRDPRVQAASRYVSAVHASAAIPGPERRYRFRRDTPLTSNRERICGHA